MSEAAGLRVSNLVIVSDPHAGCRLGLCPPGPIQLDDGGSYLPSAAQVKLWAFWEEFWSVYVPEFCHGEPFAVCLNGDAIDGVHHGTVTQISQNLADQTRIAKAILKPVVAACDGRYYHIRGTEAHVGASGQEEERLARGLGAVPNDEGQHARWEAFFRIKHALVHVTHHIGVAGSMAYESTALSRELSEAYVEAGRWHHEPPDVLIRSHRHRNTEVRIQTHKGFCTVATTAGWQLKTPLTYRIAGARQATPQIGGTVVRVGGHDIYTRHKVWSIERPAEIAL